jgi:hypothetical protein
MVFGVDLAKWVRMISHWQTGRGRLPKLAALA